MTKDRIELLMAELPKRSGCELEILLAELGKHESFMTEAQRKQLSEYRPEQPAGFLGGTAKRLI